MIPRHMFEDVFRAIESEIALYRSAELSLTVLRLSHESFAALERVHVARIAHILNHAAWTPDEYTREIKRRTFKPEWN